jgi:hypothetical protein
MCIYVCTVYVCIDMKKRGHETRSSVKVCNLL